MSQMYCRRNTVRNTDPVHFEIWQYLKYVLTKIIFFLNLLFRGVGQKHPIPTAGLESTGTILPCDWTYYPAYCLFWRVYPLKTKMTGAVSKGFSPKIFSHLTPKNEEESDLLSPLRRVKWAHFRDGITADIPFETAPSWVPVGHFENSD